MSHAMMRFEHMFNVERTRQSATSSLRRFAVMVAPAALVTFALLGVMDRLIAVDFVEPETRPVRALAAITPEIPDNQPLIDGHVRADKIEASIPPPPPEVSIRKSDIDLPAANLSGVAPSDFGLVRISAPVPATRRIGSRELIPVRPPVVIYPTKAKTRGLEGDCQVRFSVSARGRPFDISAACSDPIFERAAERAVSKAEFAPEIVDDQAVERHNVVYPIEFKLS